MRERGPEGEEGERSEGEGEIVCICEEFFFGVVVSLVK